MAHASTIEMASITKAHQLSKDFGFQYNNKPYDVFGGSTGDRDRERAAITEDR